MADSFLDIVSGVPTLKAAVASSAGAGDAGKIPRLGAAGLLDPSMMPSSILFSAMAILEDQKSAGTNGGTFSAGAFRTRDINTEVYDPSGIVTISSNQFTLIAGSFWICAEAPGYACSVHKAQLYNVSDSTVAGVGTPADARGAPYYHLGVSKISAPVTIAGSKTFEIQDKCTVDAATSGFGIAYNVSLVEVYTRVVIFKIG